MICELCLVNMYMALEMMRLGSGQALLPARAS